MTPAPDSVWYAGRWRSPEGVERRRDQSRQHMRDTYWTVRRPRELTRQLGELEAEGLAMGYSLDELRADRPEPSGPPIPKLDLS